jgi:predicted acylesterase/phospholipase RssA
MIPYRIYLSGGGMCAMAHVGALTELDKYIPLHFIKEWMGVSAGSLVSMCLCIGYSLKEMEDISVRFDFTNVKDYDSVPGWILHFGLDTGDRLMRLIQACLHVKGLSSDCTFQEIQEKFGKSLRVVATDLNEAKPVTFSPKDTPHYLVADAVRASMSFPYYFQPHLCPVTGHYLVDGAVISNYPLFVVPEEEHSSTLSILIRTSLERKENVMELEIDKLISRPLQMVLMEKNNIEAKFYDARCIQIRLGDLNILEFAFDEETKSFIINKGKEAVMDYFEKIAKPKRRHSIS